MAREVTDSSADRNDKIRNASSVIGKSARRRKVFEAVYKGKKEVKTIADIEAQTGLVHKSILEAARPLATHEIIESAGKVDGRASYKKIAFYATNRDAVVKGISSPTEAAKKFPASFDRAVPGQEVSVTVKLHRRVAAEPVTIDDIDTFARVATLTPPRSYMKLPEKEMKELLLRVAGEGGVFKDWGGEMNDIYGTRFKMKGKRVPSAFALKGPGTFGKLTPGKMGKNGDQIQRLFASPAQLFVVQYWGQVDQSVHELMRLLAIARSYLDQKTIYYCVIDGKDSDRLTLAYR